MVRTSPKQLFQLNDKENLTNIILIKYKLYHILNIFSSYEVRDIPMAGRQLYPQYLKAEFDCNKKCEEMTHDICIYILRSYKHLEQEADDMKERKKKRKLICVLYSLEQLCEISKAASFLRYRGFNDICGLVSDRPKIIGADDIISQIPTVLNMGYEFMVRTGRIPTAGKRIIKVFGRELSLVRYEPCIKIELCRVNKNGGCTVL